MTTRSIPSNRAVLFELGRKAITPGANAQLHPIEILRAPRAAARLHREKADAMVQEMGYHLRDPELLIEDAHVLMHEGELDPARDKLNEARAKIEDTGLHIHDPVVRDLEALLEEKSGEG